MTDDERRSTCEAWVVYAVSDTGEAITDVETAIKSADGLTRERLMRAKSALLEAAQHLDAIYPAPAESPVRVLRQP